MHKVFAFGLGIMLALGAVPGWCADQPLEKNKLPVAKGDVQGALTPDALRALAASFARDAAGKRLAESALRNDLKSIALNQDIVTADNPYFSHEIKTAKITDQRGSGRCWLFAGFNVLRPAVVKKLNWDEFEFSQAHLFFWDKLEKANVFLERIIERRGLDPRDVHYQYLLKNAIDDGGWWEEFVYLIRKYGVAPKSAMPETLGTTSSGPMNQQLVDMLHQGALRIHTLARENADAARLREEKDRCLRDVYRILVCHLGEPPAEFTFRYKAKEPDAKVMADVIKLYQSLMEEAGNKDFTETEAFKELVKDKVSPAQVYTPQTFAESFVIPDLADYVNLGNVPTRPLNAVYVVETSRAMVEGEDIRFLNVPIGDLKLAALQSVMADDPVWFAADVKRQVDSQTGIMHTDVYRYHDIYGVEFTMGKGERLMYGNTEPNHAMVFMGVDYVNDKVVKWLVENSWGEKPGRTGRYNMYDGWFDEYVYMCIVKKKYLPPRLRDLLGAEPVVVKETDPLGRFFRRGGGL
jgi:bleomycin hydrolase